MPELPEVESVRRGLATHLIGRRLSGVQVLDPRSVRRHPGGAVDFADRLSGHRVVGTGRRGKYLWLRLGEGDAVLIHLGMSGQLLVAPAGAPDPRHLRVRCGLDDGRELRFADQRIFGGMLLSDGGAASPAEIDHIALDPLDSSFDPVGVTERMRRRQTGVKRALLDQTLISGVGNIYADEALWRTRLHYARNTRHLRRREAGELLDHVTQVMVEALDVGGTSFDALYVNVNGESGYFDRSLDAYGQEGRPCRRCGTPIRRDPFMNRSSFTCPRCQPRPRHGRW